MGGTAYIIEGKISPERLKPSAVKQGPLDKLLRRQRYAAPKRFDIGEQEVTDIPCAELEVLKGRFREFLEERIPKPSGATAGFLDYLDLKVMTIYVRSERSRTNGDEQTYVQFTFSGCAGMGEVSAELGCHWVGFWYSHCRAAIEREHFAPFGFFPKEIQTKEPGRAFLPVHDLGYAAYSNGQFELDAGAEEAADGEDVIGQLNRSFKALMADGKCRCQLCAPEFEPVRLQGL